MRHHAEHRFLQQIFGLRKGLVERVALASAVTDIGKGDDIPAILLPFEPYRISLSLANRHRFFLSTQIAQRQPQIPQDREQRPAPDLAAAGRYDRLASAQLDLHVTALAARRIDRRAEMAQLAEEFPARHRDSYTFMCIKRPAGYWDTC